MEELEIFIEPYLSGIVLRMGQHQVVRGCFSVRPFTVRRVTDVEEVFRHLLTYYDYPGGLTDIEAVDYIISQWSKSWK